VREAPYDFAVVGLEVLPAFRPKSPLQRGSMKSSKTTIYVATNTRLREGCRVDADQPPETSRRGLSKFPGGPGARDRQLGGADHRRLFALRVLSNRSREEQGHLRACTGELYSCAGREARGRGALLYGGQQGVALLYYLAAAGPGLPSVEPPMPAPKNT
jgi:hypothetical protein